MKSTILAFAGVLACLSVPKHSFSQTNPYQLMGAAAEGNLEEAKRLIEQEGADVNAVVFLNQTPLIAAASNGHLKLVQYLLGQGANVRFAGGRWGDTALHGATDLDVVRYLVEEGGADTLQKNNWGGLPIHSAAQRGNLDLVKYFIEEQSLDVNTRMSAPYEISPLHFAANACDQELTQYLLSQGADTGLKGSMPAYTSTEKQNPLQFATSASQSPSADPAQRNRCSQVMQLLQGKT